MPRGLMMTGDKGRPALPPAWAAGGGGGLDELLLQAEEVAADEPDELVVVSRAENLRLIDTLVARLQDTAAA